MIVISEHADGGYNVVVGDRMASRLTKDEALGVVASVLFGGCTGQIFVQSQEEIEKKGEARGRRLERLGHPEDEA